MGSLQSWKQVQLQHRLLDAHSSAFGHNHCKTARLRLQGNPQACKLNVKQMQANEGGALQLTKRTAADCPSAKVHANYA